MAIGHAKDFNFEGVFSKKPRVHHIEEAQGAQLVRMWILYITSLKQTAKAPEKWMVGIRSFPFGMAYFQGLC